MKESATSTQAEKGEGRGAERSIMIRNVPASLHKALKIRAAQEDTTMQRLLLELMTSFAAGQDVKRTPINDKGGR